MPQRLFHTLTGTIAACLLAIALVPVESAEPVRFNRDIRPILAGHCFQCHGPDSAVRKAGVRFDRRENALLPADSGAIPIVPGKPDASEMVRRIFARDADEAMPTTSVNKPLSASQKELLRRWVVEGAKYEKHWSLLPPQRFEPPTVKSVGWPRNPIDNFILARLEREGLATSPDAEPATLLRRLSLDLTGLPPCPNDVALYQRTISAARSRGEADRVYRSWVDRLLASPHFGERMAVNWLDAARFADSNGYQVDRDREMWAWRDWVIGAFNADMPFDEFTVEQFAGDLLPHATLAQKIATGFHRNHMLNEEGGVIPEEFLAEYCADRVETTATVWLGLTLNCTRCHDHKFDPFTRRDFYSLFAFFNGVPEQGLGNYGVHIRRNAPPFLKLPAPEIQTKLTSLSRQLNDVKQRVAGLTRKDDAEVRRCNAKIVALSKELAETDLQIPTTLVLEEMPKPRPTFILVRGSYDKHGPPVSAETPAILPRMPAGAPRNRLGLARWLVAPANPLPARVMVNRIWQSLFGTGLVRTPGDFGTQGEPPTHPELLDWLATEFVRTGWDVKSMVRLLVTSSTYRQSSRLTERLRERDPDNRLLARGPRFRLQAEFLRDQALAASGLLASKIGGVSVKPYNPPGLYEQVGGGTYVAGKGDDLYRRSLYTYWKRSVPNPGLLTFDMPFRETCAVKRPRTNTPLQALDLMNDPTFVEAARTLGQRMAGQPVAPDAERIARGFRRLLARAPRPAEISILASAHQRALREFRQDRSGAAALIRVGSSNAEAAMIEPAELAAWTTIASTLLNLDEAVTKE